MKIVAIADTHGHFPNLPPGDVLIHAGDATMRGTEEEFARFDKWLGTLKYDYIIFTPGNHDFLIASNCDYLKNAITVINDTISFRGIKIWASPFSPTFGAWAFMRSDAELGEMYGRIPKGTNIVVTHTPPHGLLDFTIGSVHSGSKSLRSRIEELKPEFHFFGHIHEEGGKQEVVGDTLFANVSVVNEYYKNVNKPLEIDL